MGKKEAVRETYLLTSMGCHHSDLWWLESLPGEKVLLGCRGSPGADLELIAFDLNKLSEPSEYAAPGWRGNKKS